jgi:hypothetical protein
MFSGRANISRSATPIAETLWTNLWQCSQKRRLSSPRILSQSAEQRCRIVHGEVFEFIDTCDGLNLADHRRGASDPRLEPGRNRGVRVQPPGQAVNGIVPKRSQR